MTDHFNNLSPAQTERLAKLAEEAGEIVQIAMKIMRHGYTSYNPDKPEDGDNRQQLMSELQDLYKAATYMVDTCDLWINAYPHQKHGAMKYMHHQNDDDTNPLSINYKEKND